MRKISFATRTTTLKIIHKYFILPHCIIKTFNEKGHENIKNFLQISLSLPSLIIVNPNFIVYLITIP